jgi:hypothetical protein
MAIGLYMRCAKVVVGWLEGVFSVAAAGWRWVAAAAPRSGVPGDRRLFAPAFDPRWSGDGAAMFEFTSEITAVAPLADGKLIVVSRAGLGASDDGHVARAAAAAPWANASMVGEDGADRFSPLGTDDTGLRVTTENPLARITALTGLSGAKGAVGAFVLPRAAIV